MNEIHSVKNSNCVSPKNIIMKKVKNLKQNINNNNPNRYSLFYSNLSKHKKNSHVLVHKISNYNNNQKIKNNYQGKTAKVSPINFHNKIIGYININKINSSIPTMILNLNNKKYNKSNSKSKSKTNSKSKSNKKTNIKKSKEQSRNLNKEFSKSSRFSKINFSKKINYIHSISHIQNNIFKYKDFFDNNNSNSIKNKINTIKKNIKKESINNNKINNNKIIQKNNNNSNTNTNIVTAIRQNHNLKVMKLINNIIIKKKFSNLKKNSNTAINSTKNSREKKQNKNIKYLKNLNTKNNNIKNKNKNNNNKVNNTKDKRKLYNLNNIIPKKLKNKMHFSGSNIIRNIVVIPNNETNLNSLINKYSIITHGNYKMKKISNNYFNRNYIDCMQSSINIKNKKNYFFNYDANNYLSKSYGNTLIKIKSAQNSKTRSKNGTEIKNSKNKKQMNNLIGKYYENFNSNLTHKLFPITTTQTKYNINYKRNTIHKNKSITRTQNKDLGINFNITEKNKSRSKSKSKSQSKSKSRNKNKNNQKEINNINNNISNINM